MRKVIFGTLSLLLLLYLAAVASAESVVRMPYTLVTAEYTRDGLYTGEAYNGVPDDFGLFESSNRENIRWHYVGYWMDGLMDGEGGTYWDDGAMEVGTYYSPFVDDRCGVCKGASREIIVADQRVMDAIFHACLFQIAFHFVPSVCLMTIKSDEMNARKF